MTRPRLLVLIGSGETGPSMTTLHAQTLKRLGGSERVLLDTPFGFQSNADDLTDKICGFFRTSVQSPLEVASLRNAAAATALERETFLGRLERADFIFAGPGSPTYALRNWDEEVAARLRAKLRDGGCLSFASAAAITLGTWALPVYEIYKVGEPVHWRPGLDVVAELDWKVALVPHFDNAEGGGHDTRYCYMGEARLESLLAELPADTTLVGIDEHTALLIDADSGEASVRGRGGVTVHQGDAVRVYPSGSSLTLADLGAGSLSSRSPSPGPPASSAAELAPADALAASILELDSRIAGGGGDTAAHASLRSAVAALLELARRGGDPTERIAPLVSGLLELRGAARAEKRWSDADRVRDVLAAGGIEVRDTPDGVTWTLRDDA